jgi:hypothetical protein
VLWFGVPLRYNMQSRNQGNMNSNSYIRELLEPEVLSLVQATPHFIFQQDNGWSHVVRVIPSWCRTFHKQ